MQLRRITGLERDKIVKEYETIMALIKKLEFILADENEIKNIIDKEFDETIEKFGDERKTQIVAKTDEINIEDLIKQEDQIVTITHKGYIKRTAIDTYKTQKRGGTGVKGANSVDDDFFTDIFTADTHSTILFFLLQGV